jgi:hypothetical protein
MRVVGLTCVLALLGATDARAVCRVIAEEGTTPPVIDPAQAVMLVLEQGVPVGPCLAPGTTMLDGGGALDDAGSFDDAGSALDDGGGALDDAGTIYTPPDLSASCRRRKGNAVTMIVQPTFSSAGSAQFAVLVVTPDVPTVTLAQSSLFHDLAVATAPLVQHQEKDIEDPKLGKQCIGYVGCAADFSPTPNMPPSYQPPSPTADDAGLPADVTTLGPYDVAVLGGADLAAVEAWLTAHNYVFSDKDVAALGPYLNLRWTVTAVRVSTTDLQFAPLTPIAFTFESDILRLPVAIARDPAGGQMPLTVYVVADGRYDFTGAKVPYAEDSNAVSGTTFLTRSDLTVDLTAPLDLDPIGVRDYSNTTHQDVLTVIDEKHVPVTDCGCSSGGFHGCGCEVGGRRMVPWPFVTLVLVMVVGLVRRLVRKRS